jgi:hypothetical protein
VMSDEAFADTSEAFAQEGSAERAIGPAVPDGYVRFSDAVNRLTKSMYGNLPRPGIVAKFKQAYPGESIGPGWWRTRAAARLTAAARTGEFAVYLLARPRVLAEQCGVARHVAADPGPTSVPVEVLNRLLTSRGGLADHPIRPTLRTAGGNQKLLGSLKTGTLLVRSADFDRWRRAERAKRKWLTQRSSRKPRIGRPSKKTTRLRHEILARVRHGRWNARQTIASLHRMLIADGARNLPSPDTLERMVDELWEETGEIDLLRKKRCRRKHA